MTKDKVDAVGDEGSLVQLNDKDIESVANEVYRRLWRAAGYDDPKETNHFLTPTMGKTAVKNVLKDFRESAWPTTKSQRESKNGDEELRNLLRGFWNAAQRQRISEHTGNKQEAKQQGEIGQNLEEEILAQCKSSPSMEPYPPIVGAYLAWAFDRLKTIATNADSSIDQAHVCEVIIRSILDVSERGKLT